MNKLRILIQRSLQSSVEVNQQTIGSIDKGFVILVGVTHDDDASDVEYCVRKIANLRLFEDEDGKTNLAIGYVDGSIIEVSIDEAVSKKSEFDERLYELANSLSR